MKKTVLKAAGILAATVLLFASCAADDSSYSSQIDTVLYLEKPQVSAKAYPGMNFGNQLQMQTVMFFTSMKTIILNLHLLYRTLI